MTADVPPLPPKFELSERRVDELRPHPEFAKHVPDPSLARISALTDRGESAFAEPIAITQHGYLLDGYDVWHLAKHSKRSSLLCVVRPMGQEEALLSIIANHRRTMGINDFLRIQLALELEPWFRTRAKENQRVGGKEKGSSRLTEDDRLDVRIRIARAAGVSVGNVSKVKLILSKGIDNLNHATRAGEISINLAAQWSRMTPSQQGGPAKTASRRSTR